jgi:hypothetical protein
VEDIEEPEELEEPDPIENIENMEFDTQFEFDTPQEMDVEAPDEAVEQPTEANVTALSELMTDVASPVTMSGVMFGRTSAGRAALIRRFGGGGGQVTEASVTKALDWLAKVQVKEGPDRGAWRKDGEEGAINTGFVGLALLTFLAHGETPSSAKYGETVSYAIRYLVENQDSQGIFRPAGAHTSYGHAIATYAMAEAYTMTQNPLIEEPLRKAVEVMKKGIQPNGGYDYDYKQAGRSDNSLNAWHVQALKAAKIAGVGGEDLHSVLERAMDGMLALSQDRENGRTFGYSKPGYTRIITSAGSLCLHLAGRGNTKESKQAAKFIEDIFMDRDALPEWGRAFISEYGGEIYFWYYTIQAIFQEDAGGATFQKYMREMVKALVPNQHSEGYWMCFTENGKKHGPVFNTTLAALSMMVYYRHLPTNQAENMQPAQPATPVVPDEDEDEVEFNLTMM